MVRSISARVVAIVVAVLVALGVSSPVATAQSALPPQLADVEKRIEDVAWDTRNELHNQINHLVPAPYSEQLTLITDRALESVYPGMIAHRTAPRANYEACPASARACVDHANNVTWLQDGGRVVYGPVTMGPGAPATPTPRGTFTVNRKVKDEISWEFNNAPMPYAIYFTNRGHAFHQGNPSLNSAGCVRLHEQDAIAYWNHLHIGDQVVIF